MTSSPPSTAPRSGARDGLRIPSRRERLLSLARAWATAAGGMARSLALSPVDRDARSTVLRLSREFGYTHRPGPALLLRRVSIDRVTDERTAMSIREPVAGDGNISLLELLVINRLVAFRQPRRIFEIGTFRFRTTVNLAANAPSDAVVFTLDLPPETAAAALPMDTDDRKYIGGARPPAPAVPAGAADRIVALHGDSATFDFTPYHGSIDFVFIDGSHSYEYVLRDSDTALRLAAPGAMIVWHDYDTWPGVTRALNELFARDARFAGLRHVDATTLAVLDLSAPQ